MARVPYPKLEDLPEAERPIYQRMVRERGTGHIWLALANAPKILDAVMTMAGALRNDTVFEKRFRELGVVMVGLVTGSAYEFDHHWNAALKAGIPRAHLEALPEFETSALFDARDRAVMRFATEATRAGTVENATWDALRTHFGTEQIMEILLTVAV